jgi:hypothetical protein
LCESKDKIREAVIAALRRLLEPLGIEINWKSPRIQIVGNVYILSPTETLKVLRSEGLPLLEDREVVQGYVRKDLTEEEVSSLSLSEKIHKILLEMKEYMPKEYYAALVQAYTIKKFEEEGKPKKANRALDHLRERWGGMGAKMYNLVESGLFESLIYSEFQSVLQKHGGNKDAVRGEFSRLLDERLRFFQYAIWVTSRDNPELVKAKIKWRREMVPIVFAFARKVENIKTLDKAVNSLIEEEPDKYAKLEAEVTIRGARGKNVAIGDPQLIRELTGSGETKTAQQP